jgi:Protein of unknown function (DUF2844)
MTDLRTLAFSSLAALGLSAGGALPACAALGGDAASVAADAAALHGLATVTPLPAYDIHDIIGGDGTRVREFIDRSGVVFAVAWSGPAMPDLELLLGGNYAAYSTALTAMERRGLRRALRIETTDLVVETVGHMRAFSGRALTPSRIPSGTPASDLR